MLFAYHNRATLKCSCTTLPKATICAKIAVAIKGELFAPSFDTFCKNSNVTAIATVKLPCYCSPLDWSVHSSPTCLIWTSNTDRKNLSETMQKSSVRYKTKLCIWCTCALLRSVDAQCIVAENLQQDPYVVRYVSINMLANYSLPYCSIVSNMYSEISPDRWFVTFKTLRRASPVSSTNFRYCALVAVVHNLTPHTRLLCIYTKTGLV